MKTVVSADSSHPGYNSM